MSQQVIDLKPDFVKGTHLTDEQYRAMYEQSVTDPESFFAKQAEGLHWQKNFAQVKKVSYTRPVSIEWFAGGQLNLSENCLDRHLPQRANQTAILWEGDDPVDHRHITYQELYDNVCRFANVLKKNGVKKGDKVTLYMPMIPEAAYAMLACARIGAVHSVVFGGFSPEALSGRITDCGSTIVVTADYGLRGGKKVPLKANVDEALKRCPSVSRVLVVRRTGGEVAWDEARDRWYHEEVTGQPAHCPPEAMDAEAPLFILYTSGSTGKPKGVLHTTAGYSLWAMMTFKYVFDYREGELFWCTADVGWVTGHTYTVYGPLLNGATTLMYEGVPQYPDWGRFWQVVDRHDVNIIYTAPTAIRALMAQGDEYVQKSSRQSLRLLGSVGEPINPEAWLWYYNIVGEQRCPIVDTWWQTETGGALITPLPSAMKLKPGSATLPFFGVQPVILDQQGNVLDGACSGLLCLKDSWPGQARTVYGDHNRFEETYFSQYAGYYFTGDGARRDEDGYYWITGRVDDVLNVSGHRLGTAEVESALVGHAHVAEAAVVGFPHDIKGQGIYCYVTLNVGEEPSEKVRKELVEWVRRDIGPIATPDVIHFTPGLPKTRSGKIMRRILRKIAEGDTSNLGDISTLLNPEIVEELIRGRQKAA